MKRVLLLLPASGYRNDDFLAAARKLGVEIVAAADSNPFKHGKYIIGSDIPIKDEAEMRAAKPDYLLSLPYSFTEGFMK